MFSWVDTVVVAVMMVAFIFCDWYVKFCNCCEVSDVCCSMHDRGHFHDYCVEARVQEG